VADGSGVFPYTTLFRSYAVVRCILTGFFTVDQNERAVKTSFGRAQRLATPDTVDGPAGDSLDDEERQRYQYPQLKVIPPGGPYRSEEHTSELQSRENLV